MSKLILLTTLLAVPNYGALLRRTSLNEVKSGELINSMSDSVKGALDTTNSIVASVFGVEANTINQLFKKATTDLSTGLPLTILDQEPEEDLITDFWNFLEENYNENEKVSSRSSNSSSDNKQDDGAAVEGKPTNNNNNKTDLLLDLTLKTEKLFKNIKKSFYNLIKVSNKLNGGIGHSQNDKDLTKSKLQLIRTTENTLSDITENLSELVTVASQSFPFGSDVLETQNIIVEKTGESLQKVFEATTNMMTKIEESNLSDSNNKNGMAARMLLSASEKIAALANFSKKISDALIQILKLKAGISFQQDTTTTTTGAPTSGSSTTTSSTTATASTTVAPADSSTTAVPPSDSAPTTTTTSSTTTTTTPTTTTTAATPIAPAS